MKHPVLIIFGVCAILTGYWLIKTGARVVTVSCERTESAFLPVCRVGETFLGIPHGRPSTVHEITALANHGKEQRQFFLMQRLPNRKIAPVNLNKVRLDGHAEGDETVDALNRLAAFFRAPNDQRIDVRLQNEAGSVPYGILFFTLGICAVLASHWRRES